jgi:CDP-ribitol ribitolphosphotransferase
VRRSVDIGPELATFVRDVSDWADMNELMFVSDLLVTDYSSAIFEFALLGRPMAFLAPDADAYERERGFYLDFRRDMPGPIFDTTQALAAWIAAGDLDPERSVAFAGQSFEVADGHASERFVDRVVLPALRTGRIDVPGLAASSEDVHARETRADETGR